MPRREFSTGFFKEKAKRSTRVYYKEKIINYMKNFDKIRRIIS